MLLGKLWVTVGGRFKRQLDRAAQASGLIGSKNDGIRLDGVSKANHGRATTAYRFNDIGDLLSLISNYNQQGETLP